MLRVGDALERRFTDEIGGAVHIEQQEMLRRSGLQREALILAVQRVADLRAEELKMIEIGIVAALCAHAVLIDPVGKGIVVVKIVQRAEQDRFTALPPLHGSVLNRKAAQVQPLDRQQIHRVRRVVRPAARRVGVHLFACRINGIIPVADLLALDIVDPYAFGKRDPVRRLSVFGDADRRLPAVDRPGRALRPDAERSDPGQGLLVAVDVIARLREIALVLLRHGGDLRVGIRRCADVDHGVAREIGHRHVVARGADRGGGGKAVAAGRKDRGFDDRVPRGRRQRGQRGFLIVRRRLRVADPRRAHGAVFFPRAEGKVARPVVSSVRKGIQQDVRDGGRFVRGVDEAGLRAGHFQPAHHQHGVVVGVLRVRAADMIDHVILVSGRDDAVIVPRQQAVRELRGVGAAGIARQLKGHRRVVGQIRLQREILLRVLLAVNGLRAGDVPGQRQMRVIYIARGIHDGQRADGVAVFVAQRRPAVAPHFRLTVILEPVTDQIKALGIEQEHDLEGQPDGDVGAVEGEISALRREEGHGGPRVEFDQELQLHQLNADTAGKADVKPRLKTDPAPLDVGPLVRDRGKMRQLRVFQRRYPQIIGLAVKVVSVLLQQRGGHSFTAF